MRKLIVQYRYWPLPVVCWALLVSASFAWNQLQLDEKVFRLGQERAYFVYKMVESVRLWNTLHGGVYAPITERNPPNPYLDVAERDISTPAGVALTLVNPAYMTRQLTEVVDELSELRLHLTSLKPLNPINAPDAWERTQLTTFERGGQEVSEVLGQGGAAIFRFIAPLRVEQACLQCHEQQGYSLGQVRGGLSVSFPLEPLRVAEVKQLSTIGLTHFAVWLLLSLLSLLVLFHQRRELLTLETTQVSTERLVAERTSDLQAEVNERQQAEAQLRLFIESSGEGIIGMNMQGLCTLVNPEALRLLGMDDDALLLGQSVHDIIHHSNELGQIHPLEECPMYETLKHGQVVHDDNDVFWRLDGSSFAAEYRSHPLDVKGRIVGAVLTFSDVTARKQAEAQLLKLSGAIEHSPAAAVITDSTGVIEYVNPSFIAMTGYQQEDVLGRNPRLWQSGKTPATVYQDMWQTIKSGAVWQGEVLNKAKGGQMFWESVRISPMRDDAGQITHFVAVKEDITERKKQDAQVWHQAHHDGLTGLPNREMLCKRLHQLLEQHSERTHDEALAVLYIDLDGFKLVNDRFGHAAGDGLLQDTARRLESCVRDTDIVARLGGDEFVIVLSQIAGTAGAEVVASKVVHALAQPFLLTQGQASVSASVGVAMYPAHADSAGALLSHADDAMYAAKQSGRNHFRFYQPKS